MADNPARPRPSLTFFSSALENVRERVRGILSGRAPAHSSCSAGRNSYSFSRAPSLAWSPTAYREGARLEMAKIGQPYTSGRWLVKEGSEEDFIERWMAFTKWSLDNAPGAESFVLIRDSGDPRRFISFGAWDTPEAVREWRQRPEFSELLGECRALCEEFEPHDYRLAASPSR